MRPHLSAACRTPATSDSASRSWSHVPSTASHCLWRKVAVCPSRGGALCLEGMALIFLRNSVGRFAHAWFGHSFVSEWTLPLCHSSSLPPRALVVATRGLTSGPRVHVTISLFMSVNVCVHKCICTCLCAHMRVPALCVQLCHTHTRTHMNIDLGLRLVCIICLYIHSHIHVCMQACPMYYVPIFRSDVSI